MKKEEFIKKLVKCQILVIRYVERHTTLKVITHRDAENILVNGKFTCTYGEACKNLKNNIEKYCIDFKVGKEMILELLDEVEALGLKDTRFGIEPQKKFTEEENKLDMLRIKYLLFYTNEMVGTKDAEEISGLNATTLKRACQEERLLNTKKVGNTWLMHIPELEKAYNVQIHNEGNAYKIFEF